MRLCGERVGTDRNNHGTDLSELKRGLWDFTGISVSVSMHLSSPRHTEYIIVFSFLLVSFLAQGQFLRRASSVTFTFYDGGVYQLIKTYLY